MMTDNPSSLPIKYSQHNSSQSAQPLGGLDHELGSAGHPMGINSAGPYPAMNHANMPPPERYSSTMVYDNPPHLPVATGLGQHRGSQSLRQVDGHPTPMNAQFIPMAPCPPPSWPEYYATAIPEVPNDSPSHAPLPCNVTGPFQGNPNLEHSEMSVTEGLKELASHYLHNPSSHVSKLHVRRSHSGTVKVLIFLHISIASGPPRLEYHTPAISGVPDDGPSSHVPLPRNVSWPSSPGHSGMSVIEDLEDVASRYLHSPGSHVDKLRMRRSRSGAIKVLILLVMGDTM